MTELDKYIEARRKELKLHPVLKWPICSRKMPEILDFLEFISNEINTCNKMLPNAKDRLMVRAKTEEIIDEGLKRMVSYAHKSL